MKCVTYKTFIVALAVLATICAAIPAANSQALPPSTVAGTVTVNGAATDGVSVSGGGGSDTTHNGGKYTFSVTPDTPITITATYQGHSASASVTVKSGEMVVKDLSINYQVATPTPTTTPATVTPTANPQNPSATPRPTPFVTAPARLRETPTPTPVPTPAPTIEALPSTTPTIAPAMNNSTAAVVKPSVTIAPVIPSNNSTKNSNLITDIARSPGFSILLLLAAFLGAAYLVYSRGDVRAKNRKK